MRRYLYRIPYVHISRMSSLSRQQRFEAVLDSQSYEAAWRYARRLTDRREDAEDLLQTALVHAYRRLDQLRDQTRFKGWLMSIVRTQFLTWRRSQLARPRFQDELPETRAEEPDPLAEQLAEVMVQLPEPQREILSLFYIDGLNLEETGQVLDIEPQAVRQRLYRARQALRRKLESSPAGTVLAVASGGGECHETH